MVCINTRYVNDDGSLDGDYLENKDGVAVLGFLFKARRGTWRVSKMDIIYLTIILMH